MKFALIGNCALPNLSDKAHYLRMSVEPIYATQAHKLGAILYALLRQAGNFILPPACVNCQLPLADHSALCTNCWSHIQHIAPPFCERLGVPFDFDSGDGMVSVAALAKPPNWQRARAPVVFDDGARRLVHALKYYDRHDVTGVMAPMMWQAGTELLTDADGLIPVPLHQSRLWRRRYNQSALLAARLAQLSGVANFPEATIRVRATSQQVGLKSAQRRRNVRGAFAIPGDQLTHIAGQRLVIIDDVITTGATANSLAEALYEAGAAQVDVLAFALVIDGPGHHM